MSDQEHDEFVTVDRMTGPTANSWGQSLLVLEPGEEAQMVVRKVSGEEVVFTVRREPSA